MLDLCQAQGSHWCTDRHHLLAEAGNLHGLWEWWVWEFFTRGVDSIPYDMTVAGESFSGTASLILPADPSTTGPDARTVVDFGNGVTLGAS